MRHDVIMCQQVLDSRCTVCWIRCLLLVEVIRQRDAVGTSMHEKVHLRIRG